MEGEEGEDWCLRAVAVASDESLRIPWPAKCAAVTVRRACPSSTHAQNAPTPYRSDGLQCANRCRALPIAGEHARHRQHTAPACTTERTSGCCRYVARSSTPVSLYCSLSVVSLTFTLVCASQLGQALRTNHGGGFRWNSGSEHDERTQTDARRERQGEEQGVGTTALKPISRCRAPPLRRLSSEATTDAQQLSTTGSPCGYSLPH